MRPASPYLSVVATARNDDHGANLLRRVQTFLNALIAQTERRKLPLELVLVDWNPPAGRPPLAEVLQWGAAPASFRAQMHNMATVERDSTSLRRSRERRTRCTART